MKALSEIMRPEFLNRVDEIVAFRHLTEEDFKKIAVLMLSELKDGMAERGLILNWTDEVVSYLVRKSYSMTYGARNLRRQIQKDLEDAIATKLIESYLTPLSAIAVTADGDQVILNAQ